MSGTIRISFQPGDLDRWTPRRRQLIGPIALVRAFDRAAKPPKARRVNLRPVRDPKAKRGPWKAWAAR